MPSVNATKTWTDEASIISQFASSTTVWLIGFLRPPMTATFIFRLETSAYAILYLSTDENPDNIVPILNTSSSLESAEQILYNDTKSRIVYAIDSVINGIAEVQQISVINAPFQIGFEGVYTAILEGATDAIIIQDALNDLATIYPLMVTVAFVGTAYEVTFPIEMGDVSLLTIISIAFINPQYVIESVQGVASGTKLAFRLDGATSNYFDFRTGVVTNAMLTNSFNQLFTIRCPPSLYDQQTISSIVYSNEFETANPYDDSIIITNMAFCGRDALTSGYLVIGNMRPADYMCFAYKIPPSGGTVIMRFYVQSDGDSSTNTYENITMQLNQDGHWHYTCIDLLNTLQQHSVTYLTIDTFLIMNVYLNSYPFGSMFDTVTLRTSVPNGYEDQDTVTTTDQSSSGQCTFPFVYNGQTYFTCTLDENNMPICGSISNTTFYCQNSSIEGVRRLYPKYQLLYNSLNVTHSSVNKMINISFRYTSCASPTLIEPLPPTIANVTSITNASKAIGGVYDIMFKQHLYTSIPAKITGQDLTNLLQSFPDFGYVIADSTGECAQYSYTIRWLTNTKQPLIAIVNSSEVIPMNTSITVRMDQSGGGNSLFYNLPADMLRTWHTIPQVEVLVGGYSSYCSNTDNNCPFQWLIQQTPLIFAINQNGTIVTIDGIGFGSTIESNIVSIGESGSCNVTKVNTTSIICTIVNAPSGPQSVQVNVVNKGFALSNESATVIVQLSILSFQPTRGGAGGGYRLTVIGTGFSSNASITIDGNPCTNSSVANFSSITCIVPPTTNINNGQALVTVIDGTLSVNASSYFLYNTSVTPTILSISPTIFTLNGGTLNITGVGFGNSSVFVFIGSTNVSIMSLSSNQILVRLSALPPGLYPVTVNTSTGFARPLFYVEYRFYVQQISPQVGSLYGGTNVSVQGEGFDNSTVIQFRDQNNILFPCNIMSIESTQINCRTTSAVAQVMIAANGIDPIKGPGFAWLPSRQTVQQGTVVTWQWISPIVTSPLTYKILQVANPYSNQLVTGGFDSGAATASGSFSYQFATIGTYYYLSPNIDRPNGTSIRGIIDVVASTPKILTVKAMWGSFAAQTCAFPFTFRSVRYNACILINDTQAWCSPTSAYTGQRLYCTSRSVGNTRTLSSVISTVFLSGVSPTIIGIYGGILLSIIGTGFSSDIEQIQVTIGSNPCPNVRATTNEIQCIIPAQGNSSNPATIYVVSNGITVTLPSAIYYNATITPNVTSVEPTSGSTWQILNITGENFVNGQTSVRVGNILCVITSLSTTSITCTLTLSTATGYYPVIVHVNTSGDSNSDVLFFNELSLTNITPAQGSYGGGLQVKVVGDGFNGTNINVIICNQTCSSVVVLSNTELTCITPSLVPVGTNTSCNLTVIIDSISSSIPFLYTSDLTATLVSVSPTRAGTGGGTILTVNGDNFPNSTDALVVTIAGMICSVKTSNRTCITCETGSYGQSSTVAQVMVLIIGSGYAVGSVQFQYIDLWSSRWTWGGDEPPEAGTLVSIDSGVTIYLDTTTPILKVLLIDNATLIFDDSQDVALNTEYIVITNGGRLQIGNESNPFQHQAIITMYGHLRSIELPIFGAKVLALRDGTVDMHGKTTVRTWTKLGITANNGSSTITLLQQVDWPIGSQIIIATTGDFLSQQESEIRRIMNISSDGLTLTLDEPLTYTHLGITLNLNATSIDIRGEVGLLSHNIIFQGSITDTWTETIPACPDGFNPDEFAVQTCYFGRYGEEIGSDQFGATIMVSQDMTTANGTQQAILRLSNVEITYVGQAFRLSRYPINFQINGNMSMSYIKSSSVHLSFNRAINIEASNYITVENNVLYNIMGEAMSLEDGVEIGNAFKNNLVVFVRSSSSLLNEEITPAAFWLTNPNNTVENNAVAGSTHYGYWYRLLNTASGASFALYPNYSPYIQPFGRFYNNSVHSSGRFGVWIYPQYSPTINGNPSPPQAVFDGIVSWKNSKGFEWVKSNAIQIRNALAFDNNYAGISCITAFDYQNRWISSILGNGSSVVDSVIIGDTGVSSNPIIPSIAGLVGRQML
ncbi:unnamed protein product [Rotaria sp. Silwood1]|nr:unnamed protein product [Rotaria sp. Silwood1]CAF3365956.1 unnamed protein product [Rotaria sp. Silwood1]CAF4632057.1 unnamed protein product [Rotaria sp. Silwood1]